MFVTIKEHDGVREGTLLKYLLIVKLITIHKIEFNGLLRRIFFIVGTTYLLIISIITYMGFFYILSLKNYR